MQTCEKDPPVGSRDMQGATPEVTALRIGSGPGEQRGKQHRLCFQHQPTTRADSSHLSVQISRTLLCPFGPELSTHTCQRPFRNAAAADSLPLFVIIGRLISHPAPLTCTWRCSGKRSRHPSFGGAPPSGSELLHSNTLSRSQFATGPASVSAARHIADEVLSGCLWFLLV